MKNFAPADIRGISRLIGSIISQYNYRKNI
jgi:hypothetical protein